MSDTQPQRVKVRRVTRNGWRPRTSRPRVWSAKIARPVGVGLLSLLTLAAALAVGLFLGTLGALGVLVGAAMGLSRLFGRASGDKDIARRS